MKAKDLIAKLQELDPEEEIWLWDPDYMEDPVDGLEQARDRPHEPDKRWFIV